MIEWVENQDNTITNEALERHFGPRGADPVDDVQEKSEQVHVALLALDLPAGLREVRGTGSPIRKEHVERNNDSSS